MSLNAVQITSSSVPNPPKTDLGKYVTGAVGFGKKKPEWQELSPTLNCADNLSNDPT